jgi:hypothetical protein
MNLSSMCTGTTNKMMQKVGLDADTELYNTLLLQGFATPSSRLNILSIVIIRLSGAVASIIFGWPRKILRLH